MICGSWGSKGRLAKGSECGAMWPDEKWKIARRCGAKHISESTSTKHTILGPLLEVVMSKKCTLLWRKAHSQVKMCKAHHVGTTFRSWDVEKMQALWLEAHFQVETYKTRKARSTFGSWHVEKVYVVVARSTFPSQNVKTTTCSDHFWTFRCRFAWEAQGIVHLVVKNQQQGEVFVAVSIATTTALHYVTPPLQLHLKLQLHYITLHYTNYGTLHYTTQYYTRQRQLQLHCTTQHLITQHYTILH